LLNRARYWTQAAFSLRPIRVVTPKKTLLATLCTRLAAFSRHERQQAVYKPLKILISLGFLGVMNWFFTPWNW
jgi:hypothetical protein